MRELAQIALSVGAFRYFLAMELLELVGTRAGTCPECVHRYIDSGACNAGTEYWFEQRKTSGREQIVCNLIGRSLRGLC